MGIEIRSLSTTYIYIKRWPGSAKEVEVEVEVESRRKKLARGFPCSALCGALKFYIYCTIIFGAQVFGL